MAAEYQEPTRMWIFRGLVGVVAMWSSMLSPLIFGRVRALVFLAVFESCFSFVMIWYHHVWGDLVSSRFCVSNP